MDGCSGESDSQKRSGGRIPGTAARPAFTVSLTEPSAIPVLIAVPHAGRTYPQALLRGLRHPESVALRLEDRYVDRLAVQVAAATGAGLLVAHAPRAMIDLNRAPDDVDWEMFDRASRPGHAGTSPSRRVLSGLGLVPRRLPGLGELWRGGHRGQDLAARIEGVHVPYHDALGRSLEALRDRWGAALLLDLHSMPPLPSRFGAASAQFVVGDRFGVTCHGGVIAAAFAHFAECACAAAHNRPYAGGYALERHASPRAGIHAMQLEVDRSCYLDSDLVEPGPGMDATVEVLVSLVRRMGAVVADMGQDADRRGWPLAAE
ncbi:N-formylglutamate amidohydrolase [Novosphingobium endophyticum]|uniref:N-formylglutamate amidohydrolase n=1 Tax=Novosphingobium endophyticum TaxID=1955250 RepID=A0A916X624_9SPHN|nr:N-formylglutamate amidohydrolase [Novosphingobium endophyticum]GGC14093.1 N-formylglutamate amidohydrolase [Novosphingobium endophyticum]